MVTSSRTPASTDRVRPLNLPRPVEVTLDPRGRPLRLRDGKRTQDITQIQDAWEIEDEWWREPISRHYLQVVLHDGHLRTIFHDRHTGQWFCQNY